ncbi:MAG: LysR family transcriptional regulator [Candidatus Thiodiazotropha sp. (ex Dulcina madagascariensis)]|nr:LysR family transcriptional regulator [Candidatus Thiodiazotropha sp. (ex Dulcina madagascariensis)]
MMWRLDDIEIFVSVVEQGSFVQAAKRLNAPTSTVSRRISELEAALDIKLIERTSRKLHVTEKGQELFDHALHHVKEIRQQGNMLMNSRDQLRGKITITVPTFLGNAVLAPWLFEFLAKHSDIELNIKLSNHFEDLIDEGIDLAIRIGPLNDSQFIAQFLCSTEYRLCASPEYLQQNPSIETVDDLLRHDVMLLPHQNMTLDLMNVRTHETYSLSTSSRMNCNDIEMMRQAAVNGVSIACLPHLSVQKLVSSGELVTLLDEYEISPSRDIYTVYPSRKHLSAKTRLLINFLKEKAAN